MTMLTGRLALVTGGGRGLGAAIAEGLAAHGATVMVTDIDGASAEAVARAIGETGGTARGFALDVSQPAACAALAARIGAEVGPVSILVNNAGICPRNTLDSPDLRESWDRAMRVNLDGTLNVTLAFVAALRETRGTVINTASIAAYVSTATSIAYSTSKAAVKMLTQNLAQELAKDGVRVNAIAPGPFLTAMTEPTRSDPARSARFLERIPLGRYGRPQELVGPVVFLASDMSSYVTGATLPVDGGYLAV